MGLVSKGEQRTVMSYLTMNAACFYCRMFIVAGLLCFRMYYMTNDIKTTTTTDLYLPSAYLTKVQKGVYHSGIKVFNCLPTGIKSLSGDVRNFKSALKRFLLEGSFYTIQEYFDWDILSNPSLGKLTIINDCWHCCFNNYLFIVFFSVFVTICECIYLFDNTYIYM